MAEEAAGRLRNRGGGGGSATDLGGASDSELAAAGAAMSKDWHDRLSGSEKAAVEHYSSNDFTEINRFCREGNTLSLDEEKAAETVKGVDKALGAASLKETSVVYRGISDLGDLGLSEAKLDGATIHDNAFLFTSLAAKVCHDFVGKKGGTTQDHGPQGHPRGLDAWPDEVRRGARGAIRPRINPDRQESFARSRGPAGDRANSPTAEKSVAMAAKPRAGKRGNGGRNDSAGWPATSSREARRRD